MSTTEQTTHWFRTGEQRLSDLSDQLAAADLAQPSLLPGWSRAHVVGHLIANAHALGNLVTWARTGLETPMYPSRQARNEEIEVLAQRDPDWLRSELLISSRQLVTDFGALTAAQLQARIRTFQGADRPAEFLAWMRTGESFIHSVDLDIGLGFQDIPAELIDELLQEAGATLGAKVANGVVLAPSDRDRVWQLGPDDGATRVTGTAAELAGWLLGRPVPAGSTLSERPDLPAWL
jgi:maleylpyruvate isomerase